MLSSLKYLLAITLLVTCGVKPTPPQVTITQLLDREIERITPNLKYCDGVVAGSSQNNADLRWNCNIGDSWIHSGEWLLFSGQVDMIPYLQQSVDSEGRPWRAISYVGQEGQGTFSRDQTIGMILATLGGMPKVTLANVYNYAKSHDDNLCHMEQCELTPALTVLIKDTLDIPVSIPERQIADAQMYADSLIVPASYRAGLIELEVLIKIKQGRLNSVHSQVMKNLMSIVPANLFARTIFLISNGGTPIQFEEVANKLLECMKLNQGGGNTWLNGHGNDQCVTDAYGQDLISLAKLLSNYL